MELDTNRSDVAPYQVTATWRTNFIPSISRLPTELLAEIFQLSLSEVDLKSRSASFNSRSNVKRLYTMRAVTKRWHGIIEGTPSFWTTLVSALPLHVNEASILRSSNLPLFVIFYHSEPLNPVYHHSDATNKFLKLIQHTRSRWLAIVLGFFDPTDMSQYLEAPLPLLQSIIVRSTRFFSFEPDSEPLELRGGDRTNLRFVYLSGVSILWSVGRYAQLKCLTLKNVAPDGLTGGELLDTIRASPGLQVLKLKGIRTGVPPPSPITTLHHLRYIKLHSCATDLVECILRQIQAPSCTRLCLSIDDEQEFDVQLFLNETLKPFHQVLCSTHQRFGESEVLLDSDGFEWYTPSYYEMEGFSIFIDSILDSFCIAWVDSILQDEPGLRICFGNEGTPSAAVLRSVAPMRSVTKVFIRERPREADISEALQFISKALPTSTSLPSLPHLKELLLPCGGWNTRELLEMVQSRFCALSWENMERTPLTITVQRGGFYWGGTPGPILDLATIVETRKTSGVQCVRLAGWKDPVGILAVVWSEEGSEPVWV